MINQSAWHPVVTIAIGKWRLEKFEKAKDGRANPDASRMRFQLLVPTGSGRPLS
jgi:hypothetical protein